EFRRGLPGGPARFPGGRVGRRGWFRFSTRSRPAMLSQMPQPAQRPWRTTLSRERRDMNEKPRGTEDPQGYSAEIDARDSLASVRLSDRPDTARRVLNDNVARVGCVGGGCVFDHSRLLNQAQCALEQNLSHRLVARRVRLVQKTAGFVAKRLGVFHSRSSQGGQCSSRRITVLRLMLPLADAIASAMAARRLNDDLIEMAFVRHVRHFID